MMSLFARYASEKDGYTVLENEVSFASYRILGETIYLREIYVIPEMRRTHTASKLADEVCEIGRERGCKTITGSVSIRSNHCTENMATLIGYGMRCKEIHGELILFEKEI